MAENAIVTADLVTNYGGRAEDVSSTVWKDPNGNGNDLTIVLDDVNG